MNYVVRVHAAAERALRDATLWYGVRSGDLALAGRWLTGFRAAIESLRQNPERLPLATESDAFPFELRQLHYGSGRRKTHRALFRVTGDIVEVLAIRHVSQRDLEPGDV